MPGHTGSHGGNKGFGGNKGKGGRRSSSAAQRGKKDNTPQGIGGMTPGRGPGGVMVGGAAPPSAGQAAAQGGTTAGFAGQPTGGGQGGGGQSLQDLFAAQQPPAQGIETIPNLPTIPTDQELMQMVNEAPFIGPTTAPNTALSQYMDLPYGYADYFGYINPLDEDNQPAYEGNMSLMDSFRMNPTFSNMENLFNAASDFMNPSFEIGPGTLGVDIDPFEQEGGINFTVPLGPQSSLVNPDTSGIMQVAELTEDQKNFMKTPMQNLDFQSEDSLFNKIKQMEDKGFMGFGGQEPTTREEFDQFISSPEYKSAFI